MYALEVVVKVAQLGGQLYTQLYTDELGESLNIDLDYV